MKGKALDKRELLKNLVWMVVLTAGIALYYGWLYGQLLLGSAVFLSGCCFSALDFGGWCATWGCLIPPSMELSACLERQKSTLSSIWSRTRTGKVSGKRFSWAFCLWQFPSVFDIISYLRKNPRSENPIRCGGFAA